MGSPMNPRTLSPFANSPDLDMSGENSSCDEIMSPEEEERRRGNRDRRGRRRSSVIMRLVDEEKGFIEREAGAFATAAISPRGRREDEHDSPLKRNYVIPPTPIEENPTVEEGLGEEAQL